MRSFPSAIQCDDPSAPAPPQVWGAPALGKVRTVRRGARSGHLGTPREGTRSPRCSTERGPLADLSPGKAGPTSWTSPRDGSLIASVTTGPPNTGPGAAEAWGAEVLSLTGAMAGHAGAQALPLPGWAQGAAIRTVTLGSLRHRGFGQPDPGCARTLPSWALRPWRPLQRRWSEWKHEMGFRNQKWLSAFRTGRLAGRGAAGDTGCGFLSLGGLSGERHARLAGAGAAVGSRPCHGGLRGPALGQTRGAQVPAH